ncbi:MAG: molybdenum cofactor biosynthesis protein MoaE, partial [Thermoleophilaceae bacterium]|nr:molybdenum cofactor biosynthesis protein MoaE [Thermoleophilaceae bacterium]
SVMTIKVRLFAMLRERAGGGEFELELPAAISAREALAVIGEHMGIADLIERFPLALAVNRDVIHRDVQLNDGDELALIHPVSGGAAVTPLIHALVTTDELSVDHLSKLVAHDDAGAIVTFQGTTRSVDRLDYEAYAEMATPAIEKILTEVAAKHNLLAAAAEHRTGAVLRKQTSVVVAVSSAHRAEAFSAAREALDRIKSEVPIWKREIEFEAGGERATWVEGQPLSEAKQ